MTISHWVDKDPVTQGSPVFIQIVNALFVCKHAVTLERAANTNVRLLQLQAQPAGASSKGLLLKPGQ